MDGREGRGERGFRGGWRTRKRKENKLLFIKTIYKKKNRYRLQKTKRWKTGGIRKGESKFQQGSSSAIPRLSRRDKTPGKSGTRSIVKILESQGGWKKGGAREAKRGQRKTDEELIGTFTVRLPRQRGKRTGAKTGGGRTHANLH